VVFLIPYALFLALATRRGRAGVAGVAIITLQSLISELSLIPDWSSAQAALAQDIGVLPVICVGTIVTMNLVMITCGTLELVRSWRGRRRGAVAVPAV
jgi:hypothetical protein